MSIIGRLLAWLDGVMDRAMDIDWGIDDDAPSAECDYSCVAPPREFCSPECEARAAD